jgi:flagellar biosynthetic protein FliQ
MDGDAILRLLREGLLLVLMVSAVPMLVAMAVGLTTSLLQATTQIQDQTIGFVPKLIAVFAALALAGPWMLWQVVRFAAAVFETIALIK